MTTTEDELIALAVAVGLLDQPQPSDLIRTPDAQVWYDPATGALVRVPQCGRVIA